MMLSMSVLCVSLFEKVSQHMGERVIFQLICMKVYRRHEINNRLQGVWNLNNSQEEIVLFLPWRLPLWKKAKQTITEYSHIS